MTIPEITRVCFVGAGTMGCYNALVSALAGYEVVLYDQRQESLDAVSQVQQGLAGLFIDAGFCQQADIDAALSRTRISGNLEEAVADVDLVSESVFEDLQLKRSVHRELDAVCEPQTILTSNSSGLLTSDLEDVVQRGSLFAALHSHLGSPLVDIVPGPRTSPRTLDVLSRYVCSFRGEPLVLKRENPGYVLNAMLGPVMGTALALCIRGDADVTEVDRAWMASQGAPMGPFGMMDLFGLPLLRDSWLHRDRDDALQAFRDPVLAVLEAKVAEGKLGMKSGAGFYTYPNPQYQQAGFATAGEDLPVARCLQAVLVAQGVMLAEHDIASPEDIDRAWCIGTGLARGPFGIATGLGLEKIAADIQQLCRDELLQDSAFAPVRRYLQALLLASSNGG